MTLAIALAIALVISGVMAGAPVAPHAANRSSDDMCTAPPADATDWTPIEVNGVTMQIPANFVISSTASYQRMYTKDKASVQLWVGHAMPHQPNTYGLTTCHIVLGGRPATITLSKGVGSVRLRAEWPATDGIGIVDVIIIAQFEAELFALRSMLWTVHFPSYAAAKSIDPRCAKTPGAPPKIGTVLDTGVVSMLASGATPPLPTGSAVFEFSFDSTGAMASLNITAASIPDSAVRRLAMIVGSNVKDQPPGAKRVAVRVEIAAAGLSYSAAPVSACGPR